VGIGPWGIGLCQSSPWTGGDDQRSVDGAGEHTSPGVKEAGACPESEEEEGTGDVDGNITRTRRRGTGTQKGGLG